MKSRLAYRVLQVLSVIIIFSVASPSEARKIKTRYAIPKRQEQSNPEQNKTGDRIILTADSLAVYDSIRKAVRFYGFDKTVASNLESFFINNGLDSDIEGMEIDIFYNDMKGRRLHRRNVNLDCSIPAGETIRTDIKSWDSQKSFYFHQSVRPKRQATPFDVKIELTSLTLSSPEDS